MSEGWRSSKWGDEVTLQYGKAIRGYQNATAPYRVFGSNGPVGWHTDALASGPGVILGRKGAYRGVRYSEEPFFVIDTAYYLQPKSCMNMRWLYYAVIHHRLGEIDDGSPIPSTTRAAVYVRDIDVPSVAEQTAIADALGALDDRINLNRRTNDTLEAVAQAIFRDWFIDFGPTQRKIEGATDPVEIMGGLVADPDRAREVADMFPATFGENELPKSWSLQPLQGTGRIVTGKTPSTAVPAFYGDDVPFLKIPDMHGQMYVIQTQSMLSLSGASSQRKQTVPRGSISVSCIATPGLVVLNHRDVQTNQQINTVIPETEEESLFLFWSCRKLSSEIMMGGSGGSVFHNMNKSTFSSLEVLRPSHRVAAEFSRLVSPLHDLILANAHQNRTLALARDLLLPKLMSGEIRLDARAMAEEAV